MKDPKDIYTRLTEQAIAGLQKDGLKWFRPWTNAQGDIEWPINNSNGREYKGLNVLLLTAAMRQHGYTHNEWLTYKQAAAKGGQVRKGSKSEEVIFWCVGYVCDGKFYSSLEKAKAAGHNPTSRDKRFSVRSYRVFNVAQCDNIEPRRKSQEGAEIAPQENAEHVAVTCTKLVMPYKGRPEVVYEDNAAWYSPKRDVVNMPALERFARCEDYWSTLFHELVHSTGHEERLNRKGVANNDGFGTDTYAQEELVAEMGAQFLCAMAGIDNDLDNSQAYINNWCEKLQSEPRWIVYGSTQAQKAVEYITGAA